MAQAQQIRSIILQNYPPSPAVVVAAAATDGGGCARQIIAVPPQPEISLFCLRHHLS
jgi:hypothetical protein